MTHNLSQGFIRNFLGNAPLWYKQSIIAFLLINPVLLLIAGPFLTGWALIGQFIFTLAMALKCYPLQPGGLLAIEAVILGMTSPESVYHEVTANIQVILLLIFMVAGIYFMKHLLLYVFTKLLVNIKSKLLLSLLFSFVSAVLSAFLDALTVTAVLISVSIGFYDVYHKVFSRGDVSEKLAKAHTEDLRRFRAYLRSIVMHGAVGTALGGVCTVVGEPQNLLIAEKAGWQFSEFFLVIAPVTIPVMFAGLLTCVVLEKLKLFGYGTELPENIRKILVEFAEEEDKKRCYKDTAALIIQALAAGILMIALAFHLAEVGLIGLVIIILLTAFNGIVEEHQIGHAFEEALPFTALLVVFFGVVAVIHEQHLFQPITDAVLALDIGHQAPMLFLVNGVLSMISDNVFVATVYINEIKAGLDNGIITREHFENLAIAINTGTNLPSVATPNGQAAFLFLLTSALAPLIRLSYGRMVIMALPYTFVLSSVGLMSLILFVK
ncbi:Na+/H+ antiporter NhaB [Candidatus Endobugula sertula]|uniref:Na(+)/H(+) antiporter NhaB n=1 Tax=Candidatus Endobugula sertula TaxID=62101 RepID=A0A1D2QPC0_9GAMM|nr:Na+/H+ antiporter NhaB [Candidatus Endobugula sertula]